MDIHLEYVGTYEGVEGDSASITMTTVIFSALENIPVRQDVAMTGSLNVRGRVLPIGAATAKLEAAASAGIRLALVPVDNGKDVMIRNRFYKTMDVYTVSTIRDVIEYACVDCPEKAALMERLAPLNPDGSTAVKIEPPVEHEYSAEELEEASRLAEEVNVVTEVVEEEGGIVSQDSHIVWTDEDRNPPSETASGSEEEKKEE